MVSMQKDAFLALINSQGNATGVKWDDLLIKFEWSFELKEILQNSVNLDIGNCIEKAGETMKFMFNKEMVDMWHN